MGRRQRVAQLRGLAEERPIDLGRLVGKRRGCFRRAGGERLGAALDRSGNRGLALFQRHFKHAGAGRQRRRHRHRLIREQLFQLLAALADGKVDRGDPVVERRADLVVRRRQRIAQV